MAEAEELQGFKDHLKFEEGMDETMLSFYLQMGKKYAKRATGKDAIDLAYFLGGIFFTFGVPESEMENALNALTPLILQESLVNDDAEATSK